MIGDTITVYLRNTFAPYMIVDSAKGYLNSLGEGTFIFISASNATNYYIIVKHRNSLETWSALGQSFVTSQLIYNFSTSQAQAYGNNLIQVDSSPIRFAIFSGDVNQDGIIEGADLVEVDNDAFNLVTGNVNTDVTGDNFVDGSDLSIVDNNAFGLVIVRRP